ncbi:hypothetical protein DEI92_08605 [Curtobacterium sp. MCBD17_034]|uniref:amidase domain-containing protein n=1 Tax=unclassified Curtobacterium TaxID=257496 RepID=UPI000DA846DF|nr:MULTISPECIES: amidase domain-containing protein [unclassified Curtobacterium]PZF60390.1 hypothetical protein DEI92_08605 [Curtobacterium sp. MCBD17_034]PZM35076.1 hypothetical protein DEI90_06590 [Curtobacterium sp. MCBD17_031]
MTAPAALTRRSLFSLAGVAGVGLALAACTADDRSSGSATHGPTTGSASTGAAHPVARALSPAQVPLAGGVTVTVTGSGLARVAGVTVGGLAARDVHATGERVTFTAPHQASYAPGRAEVALFTRAVEPVPSANVTTSDGNGSTSNDGVSGDTATSGATATPTPTAATAGTPVATTTLTYAALTAVDRQLQYAMAHWSNYNLAEYGNMNAIGGDCANFVSQTLVARGWQQRDDWYNHDAGAEHSATWTYCPSLDPWLQTNAAAFGLTRRTLDERAKVGVGDIVMWDWNGNGSPDHTTIVSEVFPKPDGTVLIKSASHNEDGPYRDLDEMLTVQHPGGTAWFHTFDA